eukprot:scaffold133220_cov67-Cyclotella_meneghiniana.AAC.4
MTHSIVTSGLDIFCIGGGGVDYPSLEMSLPVVDIGSAEMSDRGIVCVLGASLESSTSGGIRGTKQHGIS